ncbi:MAG TPA: DUF6714 family protein [Kofleriaceae bacterium]|nr:DUF6714 family protein [Kofleriaceae bacterium]
MEAEIKNLAQAFPPHPLEPTTAFREWGGTYTDAERFRQGVRGRSWPELDAAFLERHHDALVFLGPSSIADYLPAYLATLLRRDRELSALPSFLWGVLTRGASAERFDERFAQLTTAQRAAIATALAEHEHELEGTSRQEDVTEVLDSYWRSLIPGKGV